MAVAAAMTADELTELHYMAPIGNLASIMKAGILSHARAETVKGHQSIADPQVQARRASKIVPGGRKLHEYVNLYFHARNPMMSKRRGDHASICVLRIDPIVIQKEGVVITTGNAASSYTRFIKAPEGLGVIDRDYVYAEWWVHPDDPIETLRHASAKCAEVLVPDVVEPAYIMGAYVSCKAGSDLCSRVRPGLPFALDGHLFFQ